MRFIFVLLVAAGATLPSLRGQAPMPDGSASRAAMKRLDFLVGHWRGEGWMTRGAGERVQTTMTETVQPKLGGTVLHIEGLGMVPAEGGAPARTVHNALAIVSLDPQGGYVLRSYIATGQSGDFVLTPIDGGVVWSRDVGTGKIRNTARIANGEWHEVGEYSRDGTTWIPIMEIHLRRDP